MTDVDLSVVVPVCDEASSVEALTERLVPVLRDLGLVWEILFVNDGSRDDTLERLRALHGRDPAIRVLDLSRNFGHQAALTAGIDHARGRAVVTMDGDLQHPPELIGELVARWREGYEVVYTVRRETAGVGLGKRLGSRGFYALLRGLTSVSLAGQADFRLLDRRAVEALRSMPERARFLRGMVHWIGFRRVAVEYDAARRHAGDPKFDTRRMVAVALDGLLNFSRLPLRVASWLGLVLTLLAAVYAVYAIVVHLGAGKTVPGWTSLILVVLGLGGVQLLVLGVMGEYLGRIYDEVKGRPLYLVRERIGFSDRDAPADPSADRTP